MATKRTRAPSTSGYSKISATLETPVLDAIREKSPNVSEFLNEAAKRKLYFDHLDESIKELERQGYRGDPERQERIRKALLGPARARKRA